MHTRVVIAILVFILTILTTGCTTDRDNSLSSGKQSEDKFIVHGIMLGDSTDKLIEKLGYPLTKGQVVETQSNEIATSYKYGELSFGILDDKVVSIETTDKEYKTSDGVNVGTSYVQLIRAYSELNPREDEEKEAVYVDENDKLIFFFLDSSFKVEQITYTYKSVFETLSNISFDEIIEQTQASDTTPSALLTVAVLSDRVDDVRSLLDLGADPNTTKEGVSVLLLADYKNGTGAAKEIVEILRQAGAKVYNESLHSELSEAVVHNNLYATRELLRAGANPDAMVSTNDGEIEPSDGISVLWYAVYKGYSEIANLLLESGASPVDERQIEMQAEADMAMQNMDINQMERLLNGGLDANGGTGFGQWSETFVYYSAARNSHEMLQLLLEHGANPVGVIQAIAGRSDLADTKIYTMLIDAGDDVNRTDSQGLTALMHAAMYGNNELVTVLLEAGADVNMKDTNGLTALDYANQYNNYETTSHLQ
ncbi:ankyrin repeat domain-containing protein [Paenibacillus humicus]|uniref:ankyrin repeat domain-containing protein n=1 Tax=Paenibacillus humicus TaxID=412861 RepID=UPI003D2C7654